MKCYNYNGLLETSLVIDGSFDDAWNFNINYFCGFFWFEQHKIISRCPQLEKSDLTFFRKFSRDGQLLSTFVISLKADIFCIDTNGFLYTCSWGSADIYKYKLEEHGENVDAEEHQFIENPVEIIRSDLRYIYRISFNPVWGSLFVFANWDYPTNAYNMNQFIYEISREGGQNCKKNQHISRICKSNDDFRNLYVLDKPTCLFTGASLIAASHDTIMCIE